MTFRIHPAIGIARVGNGDDYYIGPETIAGMPQEGKLLNGGLPIRKGTETETISSGDLREEGGALKRQAARFRIYHYDDAPITSYPSGAGTEVTIGTKLPDGRMVTDIAWTVHLANKKANNWQSPDDTGVVAYQDGALPPIRNPGFGGSSEPDTPERLAKLVIDAGPRTVSGAEASIECDAATTPNVWRDGAPADLTDYPVQFPNKDVFPDLTCPSGEEINTLGGLRTDARGRLLVLGAHGRACGFAADSLPLQDFVNNNGWFDDTADGPVTAVLIFDDGSEETLAGSAWAVSTDPAYAPQTLNVVSLWDDVYTSWLENFGLNPAIYDADGPDQPYVASYKPDFQSDILPIFRAASLQMWNTNLPDTAIAAHLSVGMIGPDDDPASRLYIKALVRDPDKPEQTSVGAPMMPLSLGDSGKAFLTVSRTQYFFLSQWFDGSFVTSPPVETGAGELLDKVVLANCLGGRFSPGIDMTFIARDPELYNKDWQNPGIGPFRVALAPLTYDAIDPGKPFLGVGYIPTREGQAGVEPGDICKFMAIPWHTDYNSCATHLPAPNPGGPIDSADINDPGVFSGRSNTSLFWSWPAQRPVAVYTFDDLVANNGQLPRQRFSVRGKGTMAESLPKTAGAFKSQNVGRFQKSEDMLTNWHRIGIIIQGPAIDGYDPSFDPEYYLEVGGFQEDDANPVIPWPNTLADDPDG